MRGYEVFERVGAVAWHAAQQGTPAPIDPGSLPIGPAIEDVGETTPPFAVRLREAWSDARELWAQTTFFVLDPNSWG